jgi:DNA polymerase IV (archaeal DinB-like DNA polymerase)
VKYYIGCRGWRNLRIDTETAFYPSTLDTKDYLSYYSKVFDFVEVDLFSSNSSSFTSLNKFTFKRWAASTPVNFRFAIKIPKYLIDNSSLLGDFLEDLAPLEEKILAVVIQAPHTLTLKDGREWLDEILDICTYHGYSVALEFDHHSWYQDLTYHILKKHNAGLVWSDSHRYPIVTADFLYLRISEHEKKWVEKIKEKELESEQDKKNTNPDAGLDFAVIVVDKPSRANTVLRLLDLPERTYGHRQWIGRAIFHVDLNSFYPSCEELRDPTLVGKAHAVIMTDQGKDKITKGVVASCSYEARKLGVRSAMPLSKAKELCPDLILNPVDKQYYQQISEKVMSILEEYADILEQTSIDEAYLDCTKKVKEEINIEEYAAKIKSVIKQQCGLLSSIGVASTKSAAKIASDYKKPDGLTIIYPNQVQEFFEKLEVDRIAGIGIKTEQALKEEMGIDTIGQLAKFDVQKLMDRFGKKNGLWMWQVANGRDTNNSDPVTPREDNISLSNEHTLDHPTKDRERIPRYLNSLVDGLYERISKRGYEFRTVGVKLVRADFSVETRAISFPYFQNKKESIVSVIDGLVQEFTFDSASLPVRKVGLKVSNLVRIEKRKPPEQKTLLDYI